jgi:predicted GIY-YIG superfamily endonuclease
VGVRRFDRKFGAGLLRDLPEAPAVYVFKDEAGAVLYAGKARNIRRRLQRYRTASRRKAHRKMRTLVREASSLEVRLQPSERDALLLENELIRTLRPRYNVDGAFHFLYPLVGTGRNGDQALLCFTTRPEVFDGLGLRWAGAFRSRLRTREAFDALTQLLVRLGHPEPRTRLPAAPRIRGSRLVAIRRLPPELVPATRRFWTGESDSLVPLLFEHLLESRHARRDATAVQKWLQQLASFYRADITKLRLALRAAGHHGDFVPQAERDALFLRGDVA